MVIVDENFVETPEIYGFQGMPALRKIFQKTTLEPHEADCCFLAFDQAYEDKIFTLSAEERWVDLG